MLFVLYRNHITVNKLLLKLLQVQHLYDTFVHVFMHNLGLQV